MKWYRDNGALSMIMAGVVVLLIILLIAGCNGCLQIFWNISSPPEEYIIRDTIRSQ
jgi:hypothetical protein